MDFEDEEYYTPISIQDEEDYIKKGGVETEELCPRCKTPLWKYENNDSDYISIECIVCSYQHEGKSFSKIGK